MVTMYEAMIQAQEMKTTEEINQEIVAKTISIIRVSLRKRKDENGGKVITTVAEPAAMPINPQLGGVELSNKPVPFPDGKGDAILRPGNNMDVIQLDTSALPPAEGAEWVKKTYFLRGVGRRLKIYVLDERLNLQTGRYEKYLFPLYGTKKPINFQEAGMIGYRRFGGPNGGQVKTPGSEKIGVITMVNNNGKDLVTATIAEATFGMFDAYKGKSMTVDKAAKIATRGGNPMPVRKLGDEVRCYAIYFGKFASESESVFGKEALDGMSYTTLVEPGTLVQNRAYMFKTVSTGLEQFQMDVHIRHLDADPIRICRQDIDTNLQQELFKAVEDKGIGTRFAGRVVIICDDDVQGVQYLGDMNALKAGFDFRQISRLNVVKEFGADSPKTASLSSQVLTKCLMNDSQAAFNLFRKQHAKNLEKAFNFKPVKADRKSANSVGKWINSVLDIDPEADMKYGWLFKRLVKRLVNQVLLSDSGNVNRLHIEVPGSYKVLAGDFGAFFGVKLLKAGECFSRGLDGEKTYSMVKFPAKNGWEYGNYKVISLAGMKNRIKTAVKCGLISREEGKVLSLMFQDLESSVVVMPALAIIKKLHAGMDFDGDEGMFFETAFVGLTQDPIAVVVVPPKTEDIDEKVVIGPDYMAQMMSKQMSFGNASVGAVTNALEELQYMEFEALRSDVKAEAVRKFFEKKLRPVFVSFARQYGIKSADVSTVYERVINIDGVDNGIKFSVVNWDKIAKTISQIIAVPMTVANVMAFLHDWNSGIDRWFQEITIDSVKKFFDVHFPKGLIRALLRSSNQSYSVKMEWDDKKHKGEPKEAMPKAGGSPHAHRTPILAAQKTDPPTAAQKVLAIPELDGQYFGSEYTVKQVCYKAWDKLGDSMQESITCLLRTASAVGAVYAGTRDSDKYMHIMKCIENQIRMTMFKLAPVVRAEAVLGCIFANKMEKSVLNKIGTILLRGELMCFIAAGSKKFQEFEDIESWFDFSFDPSIMVVAVSAYDDYLDEVEEKLNGDDEDVKVDFCGDPHNGSVSMFLNDKRMSYVETGNKKDGNTPSMYGRILDGRTGIIVSIDRTPRRDGKKSTMYIVLDRVHKVAEDTNAAH